MSRREVLGAAGTAMAAGAIAPITPLFDHPMLRAQNVSPNDKLVIGLIGCAGMGSANLDNLMRFADVEVAALCDVDSNRLGGDVKKVTDKYGKAPQTMKDYRQMLDRKDIDAVIIATPDHWHALNLIHAVEAGKDVFCEKPVSYDIVEAVYMAEAAKRFKRIVQVNTWQRSGKEFVNAIQYIREGKLGKVIGCRAWITDGFRAGRQQNQTPPNGLDYDMWIGPAKMVPYRPNHVHFNWRWFLNTGGGMTTDWGVHMMDIALLGMSKDQDIVMPVSCHAHGGNWAITNDDRTAPDTTEALYRFKNPDFTLQWSVKRDTLGAPGHCTEFIGADGRVVRVWRGGWQVLAPDGKELPKEEPHEGADHGRDFIDRVKDRKRPRADLASVAKTTICCHLANASLFAGETVRWDDAKQDLVGKPGRDTIAYAREYRKPYRLPVYRPGR